jgi:hypothetical protein
MLARDDRSPRSSAFKNFFSNARLFAFAALGILTVLAAQACKKAGKPSIPVTITLIDQDWPDQQSRSLRNEQFRRFTYETKPK